MKQMRRLGLLSVTSITTRSGGAIIVCRAAACSGVIRGTMAGNVRLEHAWRQAEIWVLARPSPALRAASVNSSPKR